MFGWSIRLAAVVLVLCTPVALSGCKDAPGADGRYANHDHGNYRPP
jgi:hypothetical protein